MDGDSTFQGTSYDPVPGGSMASATVDVHGTVVAWSLGAQWLFGYLPSEAVGRPITEVFGLGGPAPIDFASYPAAWVGEVNAHARDGTPLPLQLYAHPLHGPQGIVHWYLTILDRSASQENQPPVEDPDLAHLREWTLAQSPLPVAIFNHKGQLAEMNDSMARLSGIPVQEALGKRLRELTPLPIFTEFDDLVARTLREGKLIRHEVRSQLREDSPERAWTLFFAPLKDPAGHNRGAACTVFDTSEQYWARRRLAVLNDASMRIGTTLDMTRTAEETAEVLVPQFADSAFVLLLESVFKGAEPTFAPLHDPVSLRCLVRRSTLREPLHIEGIPEPGKVARFPLNSPLGRCLSEQRSVRFRVDSAELEEWLERYPAYREIIQAAGVRSFMMLPLLVGGRPFGLILLTRRHGLAPFSKDDLLLAQDIATRAAARIDNARRYSRERSAALTLQRSLLPQRLPHNSAVEVATRYMPAGFRFGVGGDWYDVISLSGARVALVVGDVTGHGLHASATMGQLRTAVRALSDVDLVPEELLTYLDDLVIRLNTEEATYSSAEESPRPDTMPEIGATCLYAIYDPVSRRCSMARAGHPPPAVVHPDGSVEFVAMPAGPPLGVGGVPFESVEFEVSPSSLLVLYTNGLVESRTTGMDQGLEQLRAVLSQSSSSLEGVCDSVVRTLLPAGAIDDAALLVARTRALDSRKVATWDLPADPAVVGEVRAWTTRQLAAWGLEELAFTTELVVSELVTNAIRYASAPIQLRLIQDGTLICEVSDASNTAPHLRRARTFDEGGRGLFLVAQLSRRWGTRHRTNGKTIWAEQALP